MNPRTRDRLTTQKVFDEVVFSSLDWPSKTVRLERDTLQDYCQRPGSPNVSVAELYHENSKLFLRQADELLASRVDCDSVRRQFLERRKASLESAADVPIEPPECRQILSAAARVIPPELFYATELRVVAADMMLFHEPLSDKLQLLKRVSPEDRRDLRAALRLLDSPNLQPQDGPVLLLLASFARNDLLYGARGYRRTLIEAGRVSELLRHLCRQFGYNAHLRTEFSDRSVDGFAEADGVEEGVILALELEQAHDAA